MDRTRTVAVLLLVIGAVTALAGGLSLLALTLDGGASGQGGETAASAGRAVATVHEQGTTGVNVSVGVLDVTGFETDSEALAGRVVEREQFGDGTATGVRGADHGTKAAATVARVAPDADLYLGTFETPGEYEEALAWLVERDVDVVVAPVAFAGTLGDGTSQIARATTNVTERGTLVVAPSGNIAAGHWLGEYAPTDDGVHAFEGGTINEISGPAGRAEFWLAADSATGDYRLELHELGDGRETDLVATSVPYEEGSGSNQRLTVRLDEGRYGLVVRGPANDTDVRIRVASSTHSFAQSRPAGSITAPAAAPGALSVGAFDPETNRTEPFSSRGPTLDGRLGVHVVAPSTLTLPEAGSFEGTSASATFVGSVAALVLDAAPDMSPDEVRDLLTSTAEPLDGVNARSGHGRVAPGDAVAAAQASVEGDSSLSPNRRTVRRSS